MPICLFCNKRNSESASGSFCKLEHILGSYHLLGDDIRFGVMLIVGILRVSIDGAVVFATFIKEIETDGSLMTVLITFAAYEPVVSALGLTGNGDIVARLSLQILRIVPVASNIANKLESIVILFIVFW